LLNVAFLPLILPLFVAGMSLVFRCSAADISADISLFSELDAGRKNQRFRALGTKRNIAERFSRF